MTGDNKHSEHQLRRGKALSLMQRARLILDQIDSSTALSDLDEAIKATKAKIDIKG